MGMRAHLDVIAPQARRHSSNREEPIARHADGLNRIAPASRYRRTPDDSANDECRDTSLHAEPTAQNGFRSDNAQQNGCVAVTRIDALGPHSYSETPTDFNACHSNVGFSSPGVYKTPLSRIRRRILLRRHRLSQPRTNDLACAAVASIRR